ncbi:MAG: CBS domain-containing protein [Planctomycetes bacterium]|nr:CBS domain-containing protein [Planctomycetota bacterium]
MTPLATVPSKPTQTAKDYVPDVDVRWCPGCGDYAILSTIQKVFPTLGIPKENFVIVSGIGCSSRFPYYMNTYGFHSIHGRAPTFAMGIKIANPDLSVWVITGDGDGLSIGANHLMHLLRRNVDIKVLLFNNQIYGLTKGQYSPTSHIGHKTPTSPDGSIDHPIKPLSFALSAEASFVARTLDSNPKHMAEVFKAAARHRGTAFVEIMQNCVIYHDGAWTDVTDRSVRDDRLLHLEHGKPLIYGKNRNMGIRMEGTTPVIAKIGENAVTEDQFLVHDQQDPNSAYSYMLTQMNYPDFPTPVGVFRAVEGRVPYTDLLIEQVKSTIQQRGRGRLGDLLRGPSYWEVDDNNQISMKTDSPKPAAVTAPPAQTDGVEDEMRVMAELTEAERRVRKYPLLKVLGEPIGNALESRGTMNPLNFSVTDSVEQVICAFKDNHVNCILVLDEKDEMVGIVSERDVVMKVARKSMDRKSTPVEAIMTPNPVLLNDTATIGLAFNKFSIGRFRHMPIRRQDNSVGLISTTDLLFYLYDRVHDRKGSVPAGSLLDDE